MKVEHLEDTEVWQLACDLTRGVKPTVEPLNREPLGNPWRTGIRWQAWLLLCLGLAWVAGCVATRAPTAPEQQAEMVRAFFEAENLRAAGKADEAIRRLDALLQQRALRGSRAEIARRYLDACLGANRVELAQQQYLALAPNDPVVAQNCFGAIETYLFQKKDYSALRQWITRVKAKAMPEAVQVALAQWQYRALRAGGEQDCARKVLEDWAGLPPGPWKDLAHWIGRILLQEKAYDEVERLVRLLDGKIVAFPVLRAVRVALQVDLYTARQQWDDAVAYVRGEMEKRPDPEAQAAFHQLAVALGEGGLDRLDELALCALRSIKDKPGLRESAGQWYFRVAVLRANVAQGLGRVAELRQLGFDNSHAIQWFDDPSFYALAMKSGTASDFKTMLAMGQAMLGEARDKKEKAAIARILLDVTARVEEYDVALRVLEGGIPDMDAQWHEEMINKVKAHLALQAGRKEEAVARFTRYMNRVASKMEDALDPSTGEWVTREMVMGLNARRIGDILMDMGRGAEAADYHARARVYYRKALKDSDPQGSRADRIRQELKLIPNGTVGK